MFGLRKSLSSIFKRTRVDEELFESLEESLLMADVGIHASNDLISQLRVVAKKGKKGKMGKKEKEKIRIKIQIIKVMILL